MPTLIFAALIAAAIAATSFGTGWHYGRKGPLADLAKERAAFSQFKAELTLQAKKQEAENDRIRKSAESAAAAAVVSIGFADARAASAEQSARNRLAAAGDLRGVRVPGSVRDIFDASTRGAAEASAPAGRVDAPPGPAVAPAVDPVDVPVLLDTIIVNHANHLKCVGQVIGLQQYATAIYKACGGTP